MGAGVACRRMLEVDGNRRGAVRSSGDVASREDDQVRSVPGADTLSLCVAWM